MRADHYANLGTHPVYYLGLAWQATDHLRLRANGGEGYRVPSFHELFFPLVGNPNLRPERSRAIDAGIDLSLLEKRMQLSVTGFFNHYRDLITYGVDPSIGAAVLGSANRVHTYGLELEWTYLPWSNLTLGTNYTFTHSRDPDLKREVAALPQHQGLIFAEWQAQAWPLTWFAEGIYRSENFSDRLNTLKTGDSFVINAQLSYRVSPQLELYARAENLTDNRTPQLFRFAVPGVTVIGGVKIALGGK